MTEPQREIDKQLGAAIRALRHERGLTLVKLARATELSHPFLSQIERGRARPSMRSLFLIAEALGTTQQELLATASPNTSRDLQPQRGDQAATVDLTRGGARLLLHDEHVDLTEFVDVWTDWEEYFVHSRHEFLYVTAGTLEVEIREHGADESTFAILKPRDTIGYPGNTLHRFRSAGPEPASVIVVHSGPGTAHEDREEAGGTATP
ncbi:helix-turn-helix domain-containing protein [Phytoactinopolyspora halotolerans]|uniref:Helix-turn-helix domain-containing protein n=1 Tax=Phytoactinopolyspora halotolerans TaxID=1981512 RepID=A0A6L9SJI7_9ACTN|nr:XRE family transcriptional regulator [Phytoactinopolyspora halotolerans]NEE04461.1 helix-turn-helix domain-containing protein [Phytoactinopolyspora halotolerans]